jgi:DNA-binding GntR family transcriptional regulator
MLRGSKRNKMSIEASGKRIDAAPLRRVVLKDRVSELIKDAISNGKLEPGDRIVEMKLAADLGVATTSVREALFELEAQGFVTRFTNKGTFVTQLSKDDIAQIIRVRHELEGLATELAEQLATPEDIAELRAHIAEMERAATSSDLSHFYRADIQFHRKIGTLSGNRHLFKALDTIVGPLFAFFIMRNPGDSVTELMKSVEWHAKIVDAIDNRNGARLAMEEALQFFRNQENWMVFDNPAQKS